MKGRMTMVTKTTNDRFLDKYTELETFLREKNSIKANDMYSFNIMNDKDIKRDKAKWSFYRDIRNMLTHEANARKFITVTDEMFEMFSVDVYKILHPLKVSDIAVPLNKIYKVTPNEPINTIIQTMLDKNYTCTPITNENNVVIGIFSAHSLMLYFNEHKQEILEDTCNVKIRDFKHLCDLHSDQDVVYKFVSRSTTVNEVKDMFKKNFEQNKRLEVVFVTDHGKNTEKLLALLTPWDLNKCPD